VHDRGHFAVLLIPRIGEALQPSIVPGGKVPRSVLVEREALGSCLVPDQGINTLLSRWQGHRHSNPFGGNHKCARQEPLVSGDDQGCDG
jgi:hypothetical protein